MQLNTVQYVRDEPITLALCFFHSTIGLALFTTNLFIFDGSRHEAMTHQLPH